MLTPEQLERLWRHGLDALDPEPDDGLARLAADLDDDEEVPPGLPTVEEWIKLGEGR